MTSTRQSIAVAGLVVVAGAALLGLKAGLRNAPVAAASPSPISSVPKDAQSPVSRGESLGAFAGEFPKESEWKTAWRHHLAQPPSPERDAALATALAELRATSPDAATRQFLALEPSDRVATVAFTLAAAANRGAEEAVHEAIRVCDEDPAYALEYGRSVLKALAKTGDYTAALSFVIAEDSVDGWLGENAHKWLTTLFTNWARSAPDDAIRAARESVGANYRDEALQIVAAALEAR